jgi:putative endonuclease
VERNYRSRLGELDIIALDGDTVVFVEVKRRRQAECGLEAVDAGKRRRIARLALEYLCRHGALDSDVRFDVVAVEDRGLACVHVKDAFDGVFEY